jgi:hypothetical protein
MISSSGPTMSVLKAKLDVMRARLLDVPDRGYWVAAVVEEDETAPLSAEIALQRFAHEVGPDIARSLSIGQ